MKIKINNYLSFIFLVLLVQSCSKKLAEPLAAIQQTNYSTAWKKLNTYPIDYGRSDDLHFFDPLTGFVINSSGYVSYTEDGGKTWKVVFEKDQTFFRCITFKNRQEGWLGTIGPGEKLLPSKDTIALYETKDGGENWSPVKFIGPDPKGLCGLHKVTDQMIVGTGRVRSPSFFIKTNDGGKTWYSYDLSHLAGSLIATYFHDEQNGFLIGGTTNDKKNSRSLVLNTKDGGVTWDTVYLSQQKGEYPWKFSFPTKEKGFISIQRNVREGRFYHLQTNDGGKSWNEVEHAPSHYYTQGIGFIDENIGWIGGSNTWTYETRDGGSNWKKTKNIGNGFNNFQFFGDSLAYGVGFGVFKNNNVQATRSAQQKTYYSNETLRGEYNIRNGKRNGVARTFHFDGTLASKGNYKDNLKQGTWDYYNGSGNLRQTVTMKNGTIKVGRKQLKKYVGIYVMENGENRIISLEKNQLFSQRGKGRRIPIFPETINSFFYGSNADITVEFIQDKLGKIKRIRTFQNGEYSMAEKVEI